jgi:hypothetical protein
VAAVVLMGAVAALAGIGDDDWDRESHEEDAGASCSFLFNSQDGVYGLALGSGTWWRGTPVFGDYSLLLFDNGIEDTWYGGAGLTIRLMPHTRVAPFIGGGGSYNHSFRSREDDSGSGVFVVPGEDEPSDRGDSYWAGHVEAGIRVWLSNRVRLLELMGRQTWTSLDGDRGYWLIGIGTGTGF